MTEKEAIDELKYDCEKLGKAIPCDTGCGQAINTAYGMAVSALEKRTPKKINNRKVLRDFHNRPYSIRGDCPVCGSIGLLSTNTDYCNACGQKLDWSGNNSL